MASSVSISIDLLLLLFIMFVYGKLFADCRYCMRWGVLPPTKKLCDHAWKKLYIQVFLLI